MRLNLWSWAVHVRDFKSLKVHRNLWLRWIDSALRVKCKRVKRCILVHPNDVRELNYDSVLIGRSDVTKDTVRVLYDVSHCVAMLMRHRTTPF